MKKKPLGRTGVLVSELCLGTMTFGTQTNEIDAHKQLDLALASGINFIDTAEMYPVNPISKETIGKTEEFIGRWNILNAGRRSDYILATKHSGEGLKHVRNGVPISGDTIEKTIEDSLKRLQTDYIDLYQFHWPNRGSYMFRKNWNYDPSSQNKQKTIDNMMECLRVLETQVQKGNIRYFGLSNESAWGTAQWLRLSEENSLPRVQTIQNEYSLLCRLYDTDLAELSLNEDVGLL
ncbi:MAG: aldo/keto reductase, partial [Pseudomonadota bacterium]|nr:aldo/keto reductase [Pseudomonadota bacterium]